MSGLKQIIKMMGRYNFVFAFAIVLSCMVAAIEVWDTYLLSEMVNQLGSGNDSLYILILYGVLLVGGKLVERALHELDIYYDGERSAFLR